MYSPLKGCLSSGVILLFVCLVTCKSDNSTTKPGAIGPGLSPSSPLTTSDAAPGKMTPSGAIPSGIQPGQGFIINHLHMDLSKIPMEWITKAIARFKIHYAHTSHGKQITMGMMDLMKENPQLKVAIDSCDFPIQSGALAILDGMPALSGHSCDDEVQPEEFWSTEQGLAWTRATLQANPVNLSMWSWCREQNDFTPQQTQSYLDAISALEKEFPAITFVYFTGPADSGNANRQARNNQIREYCKIHHKWLFDFEDMETWINGAYHLEEGIPTKAPQYFDDDSGGHTTAPNRRNKAVAFWWMMARMAGWNGGGQ